MKKLLVLNEVAWWILFVLFYGTAAWVVAAVAARLPVSGPVGLVIALPLGPVTVILLAGLIHLLAPRLRPGKYGKEASGVRQVWGLRYLVSRLVFLGPMLPFIHYSPFLRWLAWNAQGARVAFASMMSSDITIADVPLVTVGEGSLVGSRTRLGTHVMQGDTLELGPITLGRDVVVAGDCNIGPDVHIEDGAKIMFGVGIAGHTRVGRNAFLGKLVLIGDGCTIGADAVVETESKVPNDTVIPDGGLWRNPKEHRPVGHLAAPGERDDAPAAS